MKIAESAPSAFAMPLERSRPIPTGPYKFYNREFVVITYRTDPERLREVVPGAARAGRRHGELTSSSACPIRPASATIPRPARSSRSASRARTARSGRRLRARHVSRRQFADRRRPRDLGLSQEARERPGSAHESETLVCTLHYGSVLCVTATMGYKHRELDPAPLIKALAKPSLHDQDHPARRLHAAHLRAGALLSRGRDAERRLDRPGGAAALRSRDVRRRPPAGARGRLGASHYRRRPHARPRRGRVRLSEA